MDIQQAVTQITQNASYSERLWAIEEIIHSLKSETSNQPTTTKQKFVVKPYRIGISQLPTREALYDERAEQILNGYE